MDHIYNIVLAQVAKAKAEEAKQWDPVADLREAAAARDHMEATLAAWQALPRLQKAVTSYIARLSAVRHYMPRINLPRTPAAQEAHVMCLAVATPGPLAKYIAEYNVFWTNIYRHSEEALAQSWHAGLAAERERELAIAWHDFDRIHGLSTFVALDSLATIQTETKE